MLKLYILVISAIPVILKFSEFFSLRVVGSPYLIVVLPYGGVFNYLCSLHLFSSMFFRAAILSPGKVSTSVLLNACYKTVQFLFVE